MAFSRVDDFDNIMRIKLRRAKILSKNGNNDFKTRHPAEVSAAARVNPNYDELTLRIKQQCKQYDEMVTKRRAKLAP